MGYPYGAVVEERAVVSESVLLSLYVIFNLNAV